jgi:membrane-associated phospholipid phosphatase
MLQRVRKYGAFEQFLYDAAGFGGLPVYFFIAFFSLFLPDKKLFAGLAFGLALSYLVIGLVRQVFFRKRPDGQRYFDWISRIDAGSFPSMHATRAALLCTLVWHLFEGYVLIRVAVIAVVAVVGICRMLLKKHRASDVVAGIVLGFLIGLLAKVIVPFVLPVLGIA